MALLDLWAPLALINISQASSLGAVYPPTPPPSSPAASCKCLNEPLGQLMMNAVSHFPEECLFEQDIKTQNNRKSQPCGVPESLLSLALICTPADC